MQDSFKQSMNWFHTWAGLILGWLLFIIFVTGTASYYKEEITLWMKPQTIKSIESEKTLDIAINKAIEHSNVSDNISVTLPNSRSNVISIKVKNNQKARGKNKPKALYYDASTGQELLTRETAGGNFLYRFHFELYNLPRNIARTIVGIASMAMLLILISGIIIHTRIFKDIFTFRPKNNSRGWMDAHILPAVASLPFCIIITYSGLLLFTNTLMPWGIKTNYKNNMKEYRKDINLLKVKNEIKKPNKKAKKFVNKQTINNLTHIVNKKIKNYRNLNKLGHQILISNKNRIIVQQTKNLSTILSIEKNQLEKIFNKANKIYVNNIGFFKIVKSAKDNLIKVEIRPKKLNSIFNLKMDKESLSYNLISGKLLEEKKLPVSKSKIINTNKIFKSLHMAHFANNMIRLTFFICGLACIVVIASGLILWLIKRKKKSTHTFTFSLVEKLNLGTISGLFIAIAMYFIANRIIPYDEITRKTLEINCFFITWGLSYIHSFLRDTKKAWIEQQILASILFLILPILNAILVIEKFSQIYSRDNIFIYFDIFFLGMSTIFALNAYILLKNQKRKLNEKL